MAGKLQTSSHKPEDREILTKAQEIAELLQRAVKLGYSITLQPEQMRLVISILEEAYLAKDNLWPSRQL